MYVRSAEFCHQKRALKKFVKTFTSKFEVDFVTNGSNKNIITLVTFHHHLQQITFTGQTDILKPRYPVLMKNWMSFLLELIKGSQRYLFASAKNGGYYERVLDVEKLGVKLQFLDMTVIFGKDCFVHQRD